MQDQINTKKSTREGFGKALEEFSKNKNLWVVSADLSESMNLTKFSTLSPDRFVECGIQEQNAVVVSAGIAMENPKNIAVFASFAEFLPNRCLDQIRISVCMQNLNVKLVGGHSGLSYGGDGETIQAFEDIAIMRSLPNMRVFVPASANEAYRMSIAMLTTLGPCYMRLNREPDNELFDESQDDCHGVVKQGNDILYIACGSMVSTAIEASKMIENNTGKSGTVYNCSVIKPLPSHEIISLAKLHKLVVTLEEAQVGGGLGGAISEMLCENFPMKQIRVGIEDRFGQSGEVSELRKFYGLDAESIASRVTEILRNSK